MNYTKTFQNKIFTPFTILFYKTSHSYNNFFLSKNEGPSKGHKHPLLY
jgi:hypothetical protein